MSEKVVLLQKDGGVATITINRPKALNSINVEVSEELRKELDNAEKDASVRAVVLTGNGRAFSAGGDLQTINSVKGVIDGHNLMIDTQKIVTKIMNMSKPVIAAVNGIAAGAGFNMALACDMVIASESSNFSQSFVHVGLISDFGGAYLLPKVVGVHKAKELMFTGESIDSKEAYRLGIINHLVEDDKLMETVGKMAKRLSFAAPIALRYMKEMVNDGVESTLEDILKREAELQVICFNTEDHKEGVKSFFEKRRPNFQGK
jgi:2-(1,2-epoxy-1,2-dihydrophenyl)acetyl-CoA isomerase